MFLYFWLPDFLFTALSEFNWIISIAPNNANVVVLTSMSNGLGFNPISTFDWNAATQSYAAVGNPVSFTDLSEVSLEG
jgi:hypothetical protein